MLSHVGVHHCACSMMSRATGPPSSMRIGRYYVLQTEGRKLKEAWKGSNTIDQVSPAVYVHYVASRVVGETRFSCLNHVLLKPTNCD